ncbi:MAG: hypothetical protein ACRDYA_22640 [Egibacteraceae bacterium]
MVTETSLEFWLAVFGLMIAVFAFLFQRNVEMLKFPVRMTSFGVMALGLAVLIVYATRERATQSPTTVPTEAVRMPCQWSYEYLNPSTSSTKEISESEVMSQDFTARTPQINTVVLRVAPGDGPSTMRVGIYTDANLHQPVQVLTSVPNQATWEPKRITIDPEIYIMLGQKYHLAYTSERGSLFAYYYPDDPRYVSANIGYCP